MSVVALPTMRDLLDEFDRQTLDVLAAPNGLDNPVSAITLPDADGNLGTAVHGLHLGISSAPGGVDLPEIVEACRRVGAAGLILRRGQCTPGLVELLLADEDLLSVHLSDSMSWPVLFNRLSTILSGLKQAPSIAGESVPLGDLFALVDEIASVLNASTVVENPQRQVLAYSSSDGQAIDAIREQGILGRHVPDFPGNDDTYRQMWKAHGAVRVVSGYPGHLPRLCVAVRAGSETLGSIWVVEGDHALPPDALEILNRAAAVAALHLLRLRSGPDQLGRNRASLLLSILDGESHTSTLHQFNMNPHECFGLIAYELDADLPEIVVSRIASMARFTSIDQHLSIECTMRENVVYALLCDKKPVSVTRLRAVASALVTRAQAAAGVSLRASVEETQSGAAGIAVSAKRVTQMLRLMTPGSPPGTVVSADDVGARLFLMRLKEANVDMVSPQDDLIRRIIEYDEQHGSDYLATLRANLDASGDAARASEALHVHRNTLRYRYRRLQEIFNIDLDDADERLVLALQVRLREI